MLLTLLGCMITVSKGLSNVVWVLLGINWLLEGRWREKLDMARQSHLLHVYLALFALLLCSLLWTEHQAYGWTLIREKLPLLVIPLVLLTTPPPAREARHAVLMLFSATVVVVSLISAVRLLTHSGIAYRDAVPFISHIRFALCCCMAIFLLLGEVERTGKLWLLVPTVWLAIFVLLIHSYTAVVVLGVVTLVVLLVYQPSPLLLGLWLLLFGGATGTVVYYAKEYYRPVPMAARALPPTTANNRPYTHLQDGIIENGNYINNYLCPEEMRTEWNRRSTVPYDTLGPDGYTLQSTLIRYLNALGLPKDSLGVSQLSSKQMEHIVQGVANPVYARHNPVRKMVYVMLFEYEYYRHTNAVSGFTMLQRFDLWEATLAIVGQHPWLGVGIGDLLTELHAELSRRHSDLAPTSKYPHNQYLTLLSTFGCMGCTVLLIFCAIAIVCERRRLNALMLSWMLLVMISFLTEDTLNTTTGMLLCTYFLAFRPPRCINTTPSRTASA